METKEIFAKNLKMELQLRNVSQSELARNVGIKQPTVADWLRARIMPSLDTFRKICLYLKAEPAILLNIDFEDWETPLIGLNTNAGGGYKN